MSTGLRPTAWVVAFVAAGVGACQRSMPSAGAPAPVVTVQPTIPNAPSDEQIAAILLAANYTDISYAKLATPARTQTASIQDFAKQMLTDHTGVNQKANDLFAAINLTPEDNVTSLDFRDESAAKRDLMRELSGRAFDSTYIANEVSYHTKLLDALDKVLIPGARNLQLKQFLTNVRPAVAAHLGHAQDVRTALGLAP
jgi:putative membrane protein